MIPPLEPDADERRASAPAPAPGRGPIFMIGAMGSGTTLLRLILDSHERIAVPQETGFMRAYNAHQFIPFKWSGRNWAKRMGWSREELDEELRAFYDRIFMRYAAQHGKQRWGEKTPLHTWHIDDMARVLPDAVFVGIVRHPGGSVGSNVTRWSPPLGQAISHYRRYTKELIRQAAVHKDRFVIIRYEELVLQPEPVLRELLEWLGEPWSPQVLEHHSVQGARGGKLKVEGRSRVDDPIDVARIAKWSTALDARTKLRLQRRLGRLAEFFVYSFEDPALLAPLHEGSGFLISGAEVDARIDRFPKLDLRTQGPVPLADRFLHPREIQPQRKEGPAAPAASQEPGGVAVTVWRRLPRGVRRRLVPAVRRLKERMG